MRVLVTRPQPQADEWVARLRDRGIDAVALPLLGIAPVEDPTEVDAAWRALAGAEPPAMVVFVSPNAVAGFFQRRPVGTVWPAATRAATPGPGTAAALEAHGVPAACLEQPAADAAQFDSEALWARLAARGWRGARVWIVRGEGGRDWLAETLRAAGATVSFVQSYRRGAPVLGDAERRLVQQALDAPGGALWLFSSSEAIGHLPGLAAQADWSAARAIVSHPRIAAAARSMGFGRVDEVRPEFETVLEAIRRAAGQ
jgi:uroporphyrinogen-III synthase